jgi:hypothetical protein
MATSYVVVYSRAPLSDWPADIGDDPAIIAAAGAGPGAITWGICRRPQRNRIRPGDLVVFRPRTVLPTGGPPGTAGSVMQRPTARYPSPKYGRANSTLASAITQTC